MASFQSPALTVVDGRITTTSNQIAEHFGKRHNDVMRAMRNLDCSDEFRLRNFAQSSYINDQGKEQPAYRLTRDGFVFLAMGFTGPQAARWKEAYIDAFNHMEAELREGQAGQPSEPVFRVTARELEALVFKRMKENMMLRPALEALPRRRLETEWEEYGKVLEDACKLGRMMGRFADIAQSIVSTMVVASDLSGQLVTLRKRLRQRQEEINREIVALG